MREKKKPKQAKQKVKKPEITKDGKFYELRNAAYANLPEARRLIQEDPPIVSAKNSIGETALHFLVVENLLEAVEFLAQHGSDVNNLNNFGTSAIVEAAQLGYVEMVDLLLNLGADIDVDEMVEEMEASEVEEETRNRMMAIFQQHGYITKVYNHHPTNGSTRQLRAPLR